MIEQLDKDELLALLHKRCTKCGVVKYFGEFSKHSGCSGGVASACRKCHSERKRRWSEGNKEKVSEYGRTWRRGNREKTAEYDRRYQGKNKEKKAERNRKWREENPEKRAEGVRKWQKGNPEKVAESKRKRRARKANAAGTHSAEQVKTRFDYYGNKCVYCGSEENLEIEHRIPLSRGGSDWAANLVPACKSCNCSKGTKTETEFKEFLRNKNKKTINPIATSQPIVKITTSKQTTLKRREQND